MSYIFDFDSIHAIARCRLSGKVTDDVMKSCYRDTGQFIELTNPNSGIMDMSGVVSFQVKRETILDLAHMRPLMPDACKRRVILATRPHVFGMARMFAIEGQHSRPSLHVVQTELELWAILGVKSPQFKPYTLPAKGDTALPSESV
jgi:hypothetical protein